MLENYTQLAKEDYGYYGVERQVLMRVSSSLSKMSAGSAMHDTA